MKIDIYTLLGLIKDGKAPKKIKYDGDIYILESDAIYEFFTYKTIDYDKFNTDGKRIGKALFLDNCYMHLYSEVEIIEENKKIEKIEIYEDEDGHYFLNNRDKKIYIRCDEIDFMVDKFNELIDEIKKKLKQPQFEYDNIPCNYEDDIKKIKEIIQKKKGDVKKENNNV